MKKSILVLFATLLISVLFTACNEDDTFAPIEEETTDLKEDTPHIHDYRTCGTVAHTAKLLEDPDYKRIHDKKFEKLASMSQLRSACASPTILPVAVHFQGVSNPNRQCLVALAESQIAILNNDYQGSNSDIGNWTSVASQFPGASNGEACIGFQLASQNHPSGYGISDGDLAVTINKTNGDSDNKWSGYINIFVQSNTGVLGYSPLGGSGNGDGVVVDAQAFGSGAGCGSVKPGAPYNLGRTLTHELGHYLLLDHIWGNGGCNSDDGVQDTPSQNDSNYGCPAIGVSSCNSKDMFMNYMDYTDDACMVMFSSGQAQRMENYVNSSLQNVINKAATVLGNGGGGGGGTTPTCNDGIQNGNETGVDCGGSCAPCEVEATCNDGIQNGNETGVDCGGSCAPCETPTTCERPTTVNHDVTSATTAKLTWSAVTGATKYIIKYKKQGTSQWTTRQRTATSLNITGLQNNTTYLYKVRTKCSSGNSPFTTVKTFTTTNGGGGSTCNDMTFSLTLDYWGSETTWFIKDANNVKVATGGPYQDGQEGVTKIKELCLPDGCYTFRIKDSYGDGICCYEGYGEYELVDADGYEIFYSSGEFGTFENQQFCVENGSFSRQASDRDVKAADLPLKRAND